MRWSTHLRALKGVLQYPGNAKVPQLDLVAVVKEDVLQLQVPVQQLLLVDIPVQVGTRRPTCTVAPVATL